MRVLFVILFSAAVLAVSFFGRERFRELTDAKAPVSGEASDVLEHVPARGKDPVENRRAALKAQLSASPNDLQLASSLARLEISLARQSGDPRHLSYAQAALQPWWSQKDAPDEVRLLRATLEQSSHRFAASLVDLDALIAKNPNDAQALLTRATVLAVTGRAPEALKDCEMLRAEGVLVSEVCRAQTLSNQGRSTEAYAGLTAALANNRAPAELGGWVQSTLGEVAARAGKTDAADQHFRAALVLDPADRYTRTAYVDLLLSLGRRADALALTRDHHEDDALLLRAALAGEPSTADVLRERQAASRARGDRLHLREEARFALSVEQNPETALPLALENWHAQKEHADAMLLLEASVAAKKPEAVKPLLAHLDQNGATDPALLALVASAKEQLR